MSATIRPVIAVPMLTQAHEAQGIETSLVRVLDTYGQRHWVAYCDLWRTRNLLVPTRNRDGTKHEIGTGKTRRTAYLTIENIDSFI